MDLLDAILSRVGKVRTTRHNGITEHWCLCPFHDDRHIGSFSFSERGYRCFACGAEGGLRQLAAHLGIQSSAPLPIRPRPKVTAEPEIVRDWQRDPDYWRRFLPLPETARAYYHSRGFTDATIEAHRLGYGVLPSSRCHHPRCILPVFEGGALVGLRGRALLPADTDDKWLCSGGSKTVLYNADALTSGAVVLVAEAPYSAILAGQEMPHVVAVAGTGGAGCWREDWTRRIAESEPAWALVFYDADEAGERSGQKVVASLQAAGVRARRYRWPVSTAAKTDLADLLTSGKVIPIARPKPVLAGVSSAYL